MNENNSDSLNIIAVFAHPDDEAACIGTLAKHSQRGDNVTVIFLTQGENASTLCCSPEEIIKTRRGHAKEIEEILEARYILLDMPDSGIFPSVSRAKRLASLLKELKPDIIITWGKSIQLGAGHPDHRYTFDIVLDAISYARYKNEEDEFPPHRKSISLYTPRLSLEQNSEASSVFIDVSDQLEKIKAVLKVYEKAYGEWPIFDYKSSGMLLLGRMAGGSQYTESFDKLMWRQPREYLD